MGNSEWSVTYLCKEKRLKVKCMQICCKMKTHIITLDYYRYRYLYIYIYINSSRQLQRVSKMKSDNDHVEREMNEGAVS